MKETLETIVYARNQENLSAFFFLENLSLRKKARQIGI